MNALSPSEPACSRTSAAPLPVGYGCRSVRHSDLAAIAALMRAEEVAVIGESDVTEDFLLTTWNLPRFSLDRDTWLIETLGGRVVADAWAWDEKPHLELLANFHADPDDPHREALRVHLLAHIETWSQACAAAGDQTGDPTEGHTGAPPVLGIETDEADTAKLALLGRNGFVETRRYHHMRIDLRGGYTRPVWPDGLEVREFVRDRDEAAVHAAVEEAFAEHHRAATMRLEEWKRVVFAHTGIDTRLWLVVWDGSEVAGTCLAFDNPERGYVEDLAVRKPWRGRGLGLALLLESFARLEARGHTEVVLGVDSENVTGALALYERAGMHVARSALFMEKQIRAPS